MTDLTEWIKYELYPALFEAIPQALPELNFQRWSGGWRCATCLDGSLPKRARPDKVVITTQRPGRILEQGGPNLSLIDYVITRDKLGDTKEGMLEAIKRLAKVAGLSLPQSANFDSQAYRRSQERASLMEDAQEYFVYCLEHSPGAEAVREYLTKGRGYSQELVEAMGLGFIPSQNKLRAYLVETKKHSPEQADEFIKPLNKGIGSTHRLSIPHRSGGTLKGFKFRAIGSGAEPKYLNSTGLKVGESFFNLRALQGHKDLVIVEGELDCLHATAQGLENVVAPGGDFITPAQIEDAKRRGARSFTLCFDNPPSDKFSKALDILGASGLKVYVAELPASAQEGGKTDPDSLLREQGAEALRRAIGAAIPHYEHRLQGIIDKYKEIELERGLEAKDADRMQEDVLALALSLTDPTERDRLVKLFTSLPPIKALGVTEESLSATVDKLQYRKDREAQAGGLKRLLAEAEGLQAEGKAQEALELMLSKSRELKLKDKATEFNRLLVKTDEGELSDRMRARPQSLSSGLFIENEELLLPSGAISIIAAPTSHGKTSLLLNLSLNTASQGKRVYFFTYEEASDLILMYALNIYINEELSLNNRKSLLSYYSQGTEQYFKQGQAEVFKSKKDKFFKSLISTGLLNIHYAEYDSSTLAQAILYLHKNGGAEAIYIDYMQLLSTKDKGRGEARQEELKRVCLELKDVAVSTGLPIILGAQFNRQVINHLKVQATNIGEAGDIERIASLVVGLWNNDFEYTGDKADLSDIAKKRIDTKGTIYTKILKNRGGRANLYELLSWNGNTSKIANRDPIGGQDEGKAQSLIENENIFK